MSTYTLKYLIIPDIHGRKFWKKPLEKFCDKVENVIFLGDYFDPYPDEGISDADAIANWNEIQSFITVNGLQDRSTLLIGNHDAHYMSDVFAEHASGSRKSEEYEDEIKSLLNDCNLLQIAYECQAGDKKILFTHAGVTEDWYTRHQNLI